MGREVMRYSEAFKLQVIEALETGKVSSPFEASRKYGIKGPGTVAYWIRKYGKNDLLKKVVRVESVTEKDEKKV